MSWCRLIVEKNVYMYFVSSYIIHIRICVSLKVIKDEYVSYRKLVYLNLNFVVFVERVWWVIYRLFIVIKYRFPSDQIKSFMRLDFFLILYNIVFKQPTTIPYKVLCKYCVLRFSFLHAFLCSRIQSLESICNLLIFYFSFILGFICLRHFKSPL